MKYRNLACAVLLGLSIFAPRMLAQTPKSRAGQRTAAPKTTTPAKPSATPAPKTTTTAANAPAPGALAVVNGQSITLADLDPKVREVVEGFEKNMPNLRQDALDARINSLLLENEATKRKVTGEQLMNAEVNNLVKDPTEAEIKAVYDANRQQIGDADINSVRPQITAYLRNQSAQRLAGEFVTRLRSSHSIVKGTMDINAPNLPPASVLATVDGRTITAAEFEERLKPFVYKLRREIFEAEARAVDMKINQILLEAEARKRNMTAENLFKTEVADKVREPTEAEVAKFYEDNKGRIQGDLASLRGDIAELLKSQQVNRIEGEFAQRLRAGASLQIFLIEPVQPVQKISTDDDPARGEKSAPVTVVVFTDFQCPSCAAMHPVVDEALKSYGNRVRLVVRDFPLAMHAQARKAAEAANAANAQGKFFEYINVLFKNQSALDVASLKKYATEVGLDRTRFDTALDSGQYASEVSADVAEGEAYGVDATPTIFINGVRLLNMTPEGFRTALDRALSSKTASR
jgi:protein-disulfide isomerase